MIHIDCLQKERIINNEYQENLLTDTLKAYEKLQLLAKKNCFCQGAHVLLNWATNSPLIHRILWI